MKVTTCLQGNNQSQQLQRLGVLHGLIIRNINSSNTNAYYGVNKGREAACVINVS